MRLGDVLAEHFRLKAIYIRLKFGLAVTIIWLLNSLFLLSARVIFGVWILRTLNAPKWLWIIWIGSVPCSFLVEQVETKAKS